MGTKKLQKCVYETTDDLERFLCNQDLIAPLKISFMRLFHLLFIVLFLFTQLSGQDRLSGVVREADSQEPIPFATVYFDGTTNGQHTDENGHFSLLLNGIELPASLVISHVSYEPLIVNIENGQSPLNLELKTKDLTLEAVVVKDRSQRLKNLQEFRQAFLGGDAWGERASIRNEDALLFSRDYTVDTVQVQNQYMRNMIVDANPPGAVWAPDGKSVSFEKAVNLAATAKEPLEIELPDLGYILRLDLRYFQVAYREGTTSYLGHYFFQPIEGDKKTPKKYQRKRERAYFNSSLHFLRSLYDGQLPENGYQLLEEVKGRKGREIQPFDISDHLRKVNADQLEITGLSGRKLIVLYYGDRHGRPLSPSKWKRKQPVQSGLYFGEKKCIIRPDGTTGDSSLYFSGTMGNRGVSWLLPSDYTHE